VSTVWPPKINPVADKEALGPGASPIPFKERRCGLPTVSSLTVIWLVCGPNWLGVKVTLIVQFAPAARLDPHVLLWLNSPLVATPLITTGELPALVSVAVCAVLAVPTDSGLKLKAVAGEKLRVSGLPRMETV
jgi:hypothetical protein